MKQLGRVEKGFYTGRRTSILKKDKPRIVLSEKLKEHIIGYLFLWPTISLLAIFLFYPLVRSMYLSLFMTDTAGRIVDYVGFQNYIDLFTSADFFSSLKVTVLFTLYTVPASIIFGLILAVLTHTELRGMRIFQFIFSVPLAVSVGTASVVWALLLHPTSGVFNYFLSLAELQPIFWLTDPQWALIAVSLMTIWMNLGFKYILLLAGLQGIPEELYESAKIDGASSFRIFWNITIPLLSPTIFFLAVISVIGSFQAFGQFNTMTSGGPMDSTNVFVYALYEEAFVNFQFGEGSARALVLFVIILILTKIQFKVGERKVHYQ
jgi:sn-glycerol 3-phosphate transport system permease protein